MDIDSEHFQQAQQPQLVAALSAAISKAASWMHVTFVVLPVPYTASFLHVFQAFMSAFNEVAIAHPNVVRVACVLVKIAKETGRSYRRRRCLFSTG